MISFSVVASLFPNATTVDPSLLKFSCGICVMLAKRARALAASSELRFVATPRFAITSIKDKMFSFLIPSCPAASPIRESSVAAIGIRLDKSKMPFSSALNSSGNAFIVFLTPAKAFSKSTAALNEKAPNAARGNVILVRS